jgi:hypothetical protein
VNWHLSDENENYFVWRCDAVYFYNQIVPFRMNILSPFSGYKGMDAVVASEKFVNL